MDDSQVLFRDVPVFLWVVGLGLFVGGIYLLTFMSAPVAIGIGLAVAGLLLLAFTPIVTVSVDRNAGLLVIRKLGIFNRKRQELPISKVEKVYVERHVSTDEDGTSITYRVVVGMEDGTQIPLRKGYSSGFRGKEQKADQIRAALGVSGLDQEKYAAEINARPGITPVEEEGLLAEAGITPGEHETNGVRWELETYAYGSTVGGSMLYRWLSTDFDTPGYFLYLAQRMEGQGEQKGLMNLMGNMLIKQSMRMYGFDDSYAPGLGNASSLEDVDRRLKEQFFIYTSSPAEARRLLNPWTVMPLIGWADRYALERRSKKFHQLSVLYSPNGVFVSVLNSLDAAQVDELVSLGMELLRAQGV